MGKRSSERMMPGSFDDKPVESGIPPIIANPRMQGEAIKGLTLGRRAKMGKGKRTSSRMADGPWDDKPGAGRIAPVRRRAGMMPKVVRVGPTRSIAFWAGLWVGLALGLGTAYGALLWYLGRLL